MPARQHTDLKDLMMKQTSTNSASKHRESSADSSSRESSSRISSIDPYLLDLLDDDERDDDRPKRKLGFGSKARTTSPKRPKLNPVAGAVKAESSTNVIKIDKIVLALFDDAASAADGEAMHKRLQQLLKQKELTRGTSKGEGFRNVYIQRLPSDAVIKYAVNPMHKGVRQVLQITLNPNQMEADDVQPFRDLLHRVLAFDADSLLAQLKCTRIDTCLDVENLPVNDLIVVFADARTQSTFYLASDRGGRVQTIYCGSAQSAEHACIYDQNDADDFKAQVGEKVSSPELRRVKVKEDAELGISKVPKSDRTRFEVRNVLNTPVTLRQLRTMKSAFEKFKVFRVARKPDKRLPLAFLTYLDMVRVRGLAGARLYVAEHGTREAQAEIEEHEQRLKKLKARISEFDDYALDIRAALRECGLWSVLCPAKPKQQ